MSKSKIGFSLLAAVALAVTAALPVAAAPLATKRPASHVTVTAPGSPETAPPILGVPLNTLWPGELDGTCASAAYPFGELCISYTNDPWGSSMADFNVGDCNLNDNVFLSPGTGQGQAVGGNARGAVNWDMFYAAQFFTQTGCQGGPGGILPPGNVWFNPGGSVQPWRSFTWIWWPSTVG